ncbi:unnamed protein product, partial [marine sediment metagenome]
RQQTFSTGVCNPPASQGVEVQDEGDSLGDVGLIDFLGAGVTVTKPTADDALVTIPSAGGGGGDFALIERRGRESGTEEEIIFTDIPQTYEHLYLTGYLRVVGGDEMTDGAHIIFNDDWSSTGKGRTAHVRYDSSTIIYSRRSNLMSFGKPMWDYEDPDDEYSLMWKWILEYTSSIKWKGHFGGHSRPDGRYYFSDGNWNDTDPIDHIRVRCYGGDWTAESRVALYGLKSAS